MYLVRMGVTVLPSTFPQLDYSSHDIKVRENWDDFYSLGAIT